MEPDQLTQIFHSLNKAEVRYLVVGGLAVMAHGYLRMTRDLDLFLSLEEENTAKAVQVLETLGYQPNVPVAFADFLDESVRKRWVREKNMQVFPLVSEKFPFCPIDLFVDPPMDFTKAFERRKDYGLGTDTTLPVVGLKDLLALKRAAGRPRDLLDIEELVRHKDSGEG